MFLIKENLINHINEQTREIQMKVSVVCCSTQITTKNTHLGWCFNPGHVHIWSKHKLSRSFTWSRCFKVGIFCCIFSLLLICHWRGSFWHWLCASFSVQTPCSTTEWIYLYTLFCRIFMNWNTKIIVIIRFCRWIWYLRERVRKNHKHNLHYIPFQATTVSQVLHSQEVWQNQPHSLCQSYSLRERVWFQLCQCNIACCYKQSL